MAMVVINKLGYAAKPIGMVGSKGTRKMRYKDWWLGRKRVGIVINTLPQRFWGKRIKIKVLVVSE